MTLHEWGVAAAGFACGVVVTLIVSCIVSLYIGVRDMGEAQEHWNEGRE